MKMNRRSLFGFLGVGAAAGVIHKSDARPEPEPVRVPDKPIMLCSTAAAPGLYFTTSEKFNEG